MEALSEISSLVKEYISPEVIWLVPCLYALGSIVKKSKRIDDTLIPTILCVVGIFLSALVSFASREPQGWIQWVILAAVICLNQLIKQHIRAGELQAGFDGKEDNTNEQTGN